MNRMGAGRDPEKVKINCLWTRQSSRIARECSQTWIDYKKAYVMAPNSWFLKCLEMVGAAKNVISIISNSMVCWKAVLTSGSSLSPLLFKVIMLPLTPVLGKMKLDTD